ncbi:hypothetical protein ABZV65_30220, partial [Streptomyces bauhiniae]|uniref:hypothetical protein n=1 Tax=Streptomyces bauhiniae TaxID=2340725 RepID=UPI0033AEC8C2
ADSAVTAAKVAVSAIDSTKIKDAAVTAAKIGDAAVTATKLAGGAVNELALADSAVTAAKVAVSAIDSTKIKDAAVTAAKIGAAAVTAAKLAAQSVTPAALTAALADTASQRWVDTMGDPTSWTVLQLGTGASWQHLSGVADAGSGQTVGQATGFVRLRGNVLMAYDPEVLYRVAVRIRATAQPATPDTFYVGLLGVAADGVTLVNRDGQNSGNSHTYPAASARSLPTASGWVTVVGYVKGRALAGASGSAGPNPDPRSPGVVHANVRYVSPYVWCNYVNQASAAGTMQLDVVSIEALKTGVVDSTNLVTGSVTAAAIAADAVVAGKIAADAITARELAADSVTAGKIAAGSVVTAKLAAAAVTANELAANSVTATAIAAGSVQAGALAADAVAAGKIAADAITARELAANSVTASKLAAGSVIAGKIAAGAVTAAEIAANTITAGQLAANSVTAAAIAANSVQAGALAADAVAAGKIAADAITARELAANSVTASELSANSVTAQAIAAGSITADKLTIVGGSNVLADPSFEGAGGAAIAAKAAYLSIDKTFGNGTPASLKTDATSAAAAYRAAELTLLPITVGDQVYMAVDYYPSTDWAGAEINIQARWEKADGTILSYGKLSTTTPAKGAWARFSGTVTAPAGAVLARIRVESGNATAGAVWWDNAAIRPVTPGVQIADGAITTQKMTAGSIQGDRIAANSLAADRIVSGSVTTSQLSVSTAASVLQKFYDVGAEASKWRTSGSSTTTATTPSNLTSAQVPDAQSGNSVMRAVGAISAAWRPDVLIPFDPNVLYRVSVVARQTVAGSDTAQQRLYAGVAGVAADGATLVNTAGSASAGLQHYVAASSQNLTAGAGWVRYTGYLKGSAAAGANGSSSPCPDPNAPGQVHANVRFLSPVLYLNYAAGTGTAEVSSVTIEVIETGAVQSVNIADGAVTTPKLVAGAVTTDKLVASAVTAEKIASLAITTDKLAALSITADKMAVNSVTASAIAAGSVDSTHIKAGSINADRLSLAVDGNVIADPSFEGATSDQRVAGQANWTIITPGYGTARALQVNAVNGSAVSRGLTLAMLPAVPGTKVWLAMDYLASADWNGTSVWIYAQWLDASGTVLANSEVSTTGGGATTVLGAWTTLSNVPDLPAPAGTAQLRVAVVSNKASAGTVAWDNVAARIVLASGVAGARTEISPRGLQLYDDNGDEAVALVTGRPNYVTLSSDGVPVATIDQTGAAGFQRLAVAESLTVGGTDLADVLAALPRGIQAIDYQALSKTASGTEMGFVELACDIDASRMYKFKFQGRCDPSAAGGELRLFLRTGGANGAAPTISSTQLYMAVHSMPVATSFTARLEFVRSGLALGAGTHRFLLSFANALGPSGQTCALYGNDYSIGEFWIEDIGPYVPETGGYNDGGGTSAPTPKQYIKYYNASWSGSYINRGSYDSYHGSQCFQGYYSSTNGMQASLIGFPSSLGTDLSGATIQKAEVYLYYDHWFSNAGGKAVIKAHSFTSRPSSFSCDPEAKTISWARNEGKWVDITSVFDSTKWRGIALDPNTSGTTYYGRARGYGQSNPPRLKITYTK